MNRKQLEKKTKKYLKSWSKEAIIDDIVRNMSVPALKEFIRARGGI